MNNIAYLLLAILFETSATSLLKVAEGFTKPLPTIASIILYILSFYSLSNCLKTAPIGVAYAIWSALGIVLVTIVGIIAFKQTPDWAAILGLLLIIIGVGVLNLFSKMSLH
ncbi:transporter small multidrug resistance (SMR) family [Methanobrevibacter ruminantium M1]|uniref:Transporter small multidrug resistance (SMR) family n=1 Tax=Methanobrevibacter ruminantium (strain ATCC 35063 / DSM 1093 / JCM 13430 / OCM 146 / M1) TaxID=634498 RepID=D3E0G4_METRM|nr:multidrug efflux SMR transporter [Methanobrevibacter ruminantium]ADC46210.1 transporter small multidrug resistance (SMR) family [Methanobrevibacter ruminantium M1]ADC46221.1 transporter small multidrug resistance (SMR) family [Methanobrevibacter ruminantium M1]